ncbi:SIS domain-containing protein [Salinibacterium sp. NK8237]|uniref:SIS domain-containing protein n=1 Tax=Salinibacterium sp. NK8237 TaxID=2792038 RepID=UPI0018CD591D|nr:SIS domain-containing protein [Salinibacterium sp. NK8237]MBH0130083.1 SIS domain-containing protein [Salinibacterium sp. NK8237]
MDHNQSASLLERLSEAMAGMRKSERKVAELVADDPNFVMNATMASVASSAGVSEPTVMRFCTSLGFGGFQQFKMSLAQTLALGIPATLSTIGRDDTLEQISTKVFDHTISSLDRARRHLDPVQIARAVDAIVAGTSLKLLGLGASAIIAQDAEQKFALFGMPTSAPVDPHQQFIAAAMSKPGDVVIAISNTGRTSSIVQVAALAQANGACVIGISGNASPLLEYCEIPIIVRTIEDTDVYTPTVSRLAGLVVVDILATAVTLRRGQKHMDRLTRMKEGLAQFRGSLS